MIDLKLSGSALSFDQPSLTGRHWKIHEGNFREVLSISQHYNINSTIAQIIHNRDIKFDDVPAFLKPSLKDQLPDPFSFNDMEEGVERTIQAIINQEKIVIYGDYDVDGATSSAILKRYFKLLGINAEVYIPDRFLEGYGPNLKALEKLNEAKTSLVIFVDSGTTSLDIFDTVAGWETMDSIILDHHLPAERLPKVKALINPNRKDEPGTYHYLCSAGIAFLFLVALQNRLKNLAIGPSPLPDLRQFLDLVALGTVCDVMSLKGLNRVFVKQGLQIAKLRENLGMKALCDVAKLSEALSAYHLGFVLGPRINAGGRVGTSSLGSRLLSTDSIIEAAEISQQLDIFNQQRQQIEKQVLEEAYEIIESNKLYNKSVIIVGHENWHQGVIGIVAGRIKEKYHKPVCVLSIDGEFAKASGRSIVGVDLGHAIHQAVNEKILVNGGGHQMAVGFTIETKAIEQLEVFLNGLLEKQVENLPKVIYIDTIVQVNALALDFLNSLEQLEPFGVGNHTPKFCLPYVRVSYAEMLKGEHIRCFLEDESGTKIKAMGFRVANSEISSFLLGDGRKEKFHVAGSLKKDSWNNQESVSFLIEDILRAN